MPLPATRHPLPYVGAAGRQSPHPLACAHSQVRGVLWRSQHPHRQTGYRLRADIQRRVLPALLDAPAQAPLPWQTPRLLVLDNAKYHHARLLQPWLHTHRKVLTLMFLPPYSPELNPIERVWKLTRWLATRNRHFPTLGHVVEAVQERFNLWAKPNRQMARLCAII